MWEQIQAALDAAFPLGWWDWDDALLLYIATFLVMKATIVRKETSLGWSLALTNVAFAVVYLWSFTARNWPESFVTERWAGLSLRFGVATVITWSFYLLWKSRGGERRRHPDTPEGPAGDC